MAASPSQPSWYCQEHFCHSCHSASVKACHHSRGASSKGCCYMARCPEPVRPPGCVHHLSLSALSPGSYGQIMVHWVSPNNLLTSVSAAAWTAGHRRTHVPTCARAHTWKCSGRQELERSPQVSTLKKKNNFLSEVWVEEKQVMYEPISFIHFAQGWTPSSHWRIVCMIYWIGLQPLSQAAFNWKRHNRTLESH